METIINVGADVHKDTNSVCMFDWKDGSFFAQAVIEPGVENMIRYIEKARKEYGLGNDCRFLIGYEAGPAAPLNGWTRRPISQSAWPLSF